MDEETYQAGLSKMREAWGSLYVNPTNMPGAVRASKDPSTGFIVGLRAPLVAEIINRALSGRG